MGDDVLFHLTLQIHFPYVLYCQCISRSPWNNNNNNFSVRSLSCSLSTDPVSVQIFYLSGRCKASAAETSQRQPCLSASGFLTNPSIYFCLRPSYSPSFFQHSSHHVVFWIPFLTMYLWIFFSCCFLNIITIGINKFTKMLIRFLYVFVYIISYTSNIYFLIIILHSGNLRMW